MTDHVCEVCGVWDADGMGFPIGIPGGLFVHTGGCLLALIVRRDAEIERLKTNCHSYERALDDIREALGMSPDAEHEVVVVAKITALCARVAELEEEKTMRILADTGIGTVPIGSELLKSLRARLSAAEAVVEAARIATPDISDLVWSHGDDFLRAARLGPLRRMRNRIDSYDALTTKTAGGGE